MRRWLCLAALAAVFGSPASAVTPEQAQSLPVSELARLVLGEAGALMVDVDRPTWPTTCRMVACPHYTEEQRRQPPPLSFGLTFYQRPFAVSDIADRWTGMCGVVIVDVRFDDRGAVAGFDTRVSWGAPHGIERVPAERKDHSTRLAAANEKCRAAGDPRGFFVSDVDGSAYRVAIAARLFAEAAGRGTPLPFRFKCASYQGECEGGGAEAVAARFRPSNIAQARQVDCASPHLFLTSIGQAGCYRVMFKELGESLLVEVADAWSDLRIVRVEYARERLLH